MPGCSPDSVSQACGVVEKTYEEGAGQGVGWVSGWVGAALQGALPAALGLDGLGWRGT